MSSSDPPKRGGLSLYANLLDPNSATPGSVSSGPVVYKQPDAAAAEEVAAAKNKVNAAALRFQPTKRPQIQGQKPKPKASAFPKPPTSSVTSSTSPVAGAAPTGDGIKATELAPAPVRSTLADWTAEDDDVNGFFVGEKRERGGKRRRNKKKREAAIAAQDWDDIYDPARPNSYEEYKHSDERIREIRDWKDKLYAHRSKRRRSSDSSSDGDEMVKRKMNSAFAPPSGYSFAPPPSADEQTARTSPFSHPAPVDVDMDESGEDAYTRRLRMSQQQTQSPHSRVPVETDLASAQRLPPPPPPPPPPDQPSAPAPPPLRPLPAAVAALQNATVSRAAVRYNLPPAPADLPASEDELRKMLQGEGELPSSEAADPAIAEEDAPAPRSNRPGQAKFAERLMAKMGWTKGEGLGAKGEGITTALKVQMEKRKQRSDAEGGGFIGPGGKGKIVGGKRKPGTDDGGKFGAMSAVVVLYGMLGGMDVDKEIADGLVQEIGEECGEKYGNCERVFVHRESSAESPPVYIKFVEPLSALRAVNALDGRTFNGNKIRAKFWDAEKFEDGIYE